MVPTPSSQHENMALSILIATQNKGKIAEMRRMLHIITAELGINIVGLDTLAYIEPPEENGATFIENATIKARYYADKLQMIAIADDSGLVVDVLQGAPGVHSARYGGPGLDDKDRTNLLLKNMHNIPDADRDARFVCAVCVAGNSTDMLTAEGTVEGSITRSPRGNNGFGYDPVFIPVGETRTTAELAEHEKDAISHRGRAIRAIIPDLYELLRSGTTNAK